MKLLKKSFKWILYFLMIPVIYILISLLLSLITVNKNKDATASSNEVYLNTNGVHLDIIIPLKIIDESLLNGLKTSKTDKYLSFGWGDKNFYLNTPTWGDLTFKNAFGAMLLKSETLIHLTRYNQKQNDWVKVKLSNNQLKKLNSYILKSFKVDSNQSKVILEGKGYGRFDDFYKANGSYSCIKTCNSWVNSALKESDLKACYWTPFDFGVLNKYN